MRETLGKCVVAVGAALALMVAQGCRKQAAPAPAAVARSVPRVQPNFALGPLPVEEVDEPVATARVDRVALQRPQVQPVQVQRADAQNEAVVAAQRLEDARLLERQQAASQRQQEELDQEIEQDLKMQQEMEAEPRIQDIPEVPLAAPLESTQPQ